MNKFFSNRRLVIVIVCLIVSFGLMSVSVMIRDKKSTPPLVQQFGNDVVGLVNRVVAWPVNGLKGSITGVSDLLNTYQENTRLKGQVQKLAQTQVHDQAVSQENKKLKKRIKTDTLTDRLRICQRLRHCPDPILMAGSGHYRQGEFCWH